MNVEHSLDFETVAAPATPWPLFARWFAEAEATLLTEPAAMTLATAGVDGAPSARVVLLRGFDERGFTFYTNYQSRKADEIAANARVAIADAESDAYFRTRPHGHRLSALISPQSAVIPDRRFLEERMRALEEQYAGRDDIPRPPHWGGYRVAPTMIEFWQGRENRLHDRLCYRHMPDGSWTCERLAP
jgi:pyridoxamine 5'-phosphate oxidase